MRHAVPFVSCMGHPSDHPIYKLHLAWCPCQLKVEGCGDSYNERIVNKTPMTLKDVYLHCTNYYDRHDCHLHKLIYVFIGYMNTCCKLHYDLHPSRSLVCATARHANESSSYKWLCCPYEKNGVKMNYYISTGLKKSILWEKPNEPYRDASKQEIPWTIPKPPDNLISNDSSTIVWVRHKHVIKDEIDKYYFTRLNSADMDISWTTPSEEWRDAKKMNFC